MAADHQSGKKSMMGFGRPITHAPDLLSLAGSTGASAEKNLAPDAGSWPAAAEHSQIFNFTEGGCDECQREVNVRREDGKLMGHWKIA